MASWPSSFSCFGSSAYRTATTAVFSGFRMVIDELNPFHQSTLYSISGFSSLKVRFDSIPETIRISPVLRLASASLTSLLSGRLTVPEK